MASGRTLHLPEGCTAFRQKKAAGRKFVGTVALRKRIQDIVCFNRSFIPYLVYTLLSATAPTNESMKSNTPLQATGYLTLAAVAKCLQAATWLVACGNKFIKITVDTGKFIS